MNKKISLSLLAFVCLNVLSNAQIFYQDIDPDVVLDEWSVYIVHIDSNATANLSYGDPGILSIWEEFDTQTVVDAFSDCKVMMDGGYPAALDYNDPIDPTGTWQQPDYDVLNNGTQGNWIGVTDKYLGVKVFNGSTWLYGWIRLDVNIAGNIVAIKDYACNRYPNQPINAGQTTTTSVPGDKITSQNLVAYPNPFHSYTTLETKIGFNNAAIRIFNMHGKLVKSIDEVAGTRIRISSDNLEKGIYILKIFDDKYTETIKLNVVD